MLLLYIKIKQLKTILNHSNSFYIDENLINSLTFDYIKNYKFIYLNINLDKFYQAKFRKAIDLHVIKIDYVIIIN